MGRAGLGLSWTIILVRERLGLEASESPESLEDELFLEEFEEEPELAELLLWTLVCKSGSDGSGVFVLLVVEGGLDRIGDWDTRGEGLGRVDVMLPLGLEA